jgi:hypothetical protein
MGIRDGRAAQASKSAFAGSVVQRELLAAVAEVERTRGKAKWIRECKELNRATRALEHAALAAHDAGMGWCEIADLLGIERASTVT